MLVLSRKINESIVMIIGGEKITITVVDKNSKGEARLGITAPRHIPIFRKELLERGPKWFTRETE